MDYFLTFISQPDWPIVRLHFIRSEWIVGVYLKGKGEASILYRSADREEACLPQDSGIISSCPYNESCRTSPLTTPSPSHRGSGSLSPGAVRGSSALPRPVNSPWRVDLASHFRAGLEINNWIGPRTAELVLRSWLKQFSAIVWTSEG